MEFIQSFMQFLASEMTKPVPYQSFKESWFHYVSLVIVIIAAVVFSKILRNASEKRLRKFLLIFAIVLISFEVYKQLIFTYDNAWHYRWYAFPFQFCSTPMYVALYASLTKNKKIREYLIAFLGTFGTFAGLAVMLYPMTVFISTIGINIQTMVHHGGMAAVGIALLSTQVKLESKTILKGTVVFSVLVGIAIILNGVHNSWIADGTFNMFFVNPIYRNELPVLTMIQPLVPHIVFLFIYIFGFMFVSYIVLLAGMITHKVRQRALVLVPSHSK